MKNNYLYITSIFLLLVLINPSICANGAANGVELMLNILIPTLYPFIIISNLLIKIYGKSNKNIVFLPFIFSLICGYPIGAIMAKELSLKGNKQNAEFALNYCNLPSLMYMLAVVFKHSLHLNIIYSFIFYIPVVLMCFIYFPSVKNKCSDNEESLDIKQVIRYIDDCIYDGSLAILKISGYIIMFSMIIELVKNLHIALEIKLFIIGCLEMSGAINYSNNLDLLFGKRFIFVLLVCSFGGLCTILQTYSVIKDTKLSIKKYVLCKIKLALITFLISVFFAKYKGWL